MSADEVSQKFTEDPPATPSGRAGKRLIGIDAARGLALVGLMAIHLFPSEDEVTQEPTLAWNLFSGDSAALFALLAGMGLALSSGGSAPHRGKRMTGDRIGLAARAVVIGSIGLVISAILPWDPPAYGILVYYAVFFLMTIPFLHLRPLMLFLSAAAFSIIAPILHQLLGPVLPESSAWNHTVVNLVTEPLGTASELLLTGSYPALAYMTYLLVGLGLGRLNLRSIRVQGLITGTGAALAVLANLASSLLLKVAGGYEALLATPGMTSSDLERALTFGPDEISDPSAWWLAIATPHTNTPLAIAASLGMGLLVTGVFLLIAPKAGQWLKPLAAMGAMTLTLYSAHLIALAPELHYDEPALWFVLHLITAAGFAWVWHRKFGQGPLERMVAAAARNAKQTVKDETTDATPAAPATGLPDAPKADPLLGSGRDRRDGSDSGRQ
ncbi:heparan-alpha-glucosaminide N-acetyltransferase domain-containing protein [Arthrobacter sp. VKM Ac-2550]|uniref:heparan-alpha-glucosaminide N-acetyltransferase domain-containing protein n=1 Tax=Crystallibacter permensis TaxID=1938888 RepID=UPI0022271820|nr:heparan-alpha-glucosaminide N-acetyltransferase domain-containing protein [Arthrobacter sp. VKM Ac-2550]MCW2131484.1 putative membrane protein YeiB [Arthrobacter sp. VKM Ac-2550]